MTRKPYTSDEQSGIKAGELVDLAYNKKLELLKQQEAAAHAHLNNIQRDYLDTWVLPRIDPDHKLSNIKAFRNCILGFGIIPPTEVLTAIARGFDTYLESGGGKDMSLNRAFNLKPESIRKNKKDQNTMSFFLFMHAQIKNAEENGNTLSVKQAVIRTKQHMTAIKMYLSDQEIEEQYAKKSDDINRSYNQLLSVFAE